MPVPRLYYTALHSVLRFPHPRRIITYREEGLSGFLTWHARLSFKGEIAFAAVYRYRNGAVTEPQPAIFYGNDTAIRRAAPMENARADNRGLWVRDATLVERL